MAESLRSSRPARDPDEQEIRRAAFGVGSRYPQSEHKPRRWHSDLSTYDVEMIANEEVWVGECLLLFDGRVLEVFGCPGQDSFRYHTENLQIDVSEPDRKGKRMVQLKPITKGVGCAFGISTEDWGDAAPLLERIQGAASSPT
jgi:hypothetical protein